MVYAKDINQSKSFKSGIGRIDLIYIHHKECGLLLSKYNGVEYITDSYDKGLLGVFVS